MQKSHPRVIAAKIILQVSQHHHSLESAMTFVLRQHDITPQQQSLIKAYCYGTLRWFIQFNYIINGLLHKPFNKKNHDLLCLLCISLYELMHMRTATYAVVNESVNNAVELNKTWAKGLVNKILHQFLQHREAIEQKIKHKPTVYYSHPDWLIESLQQAWPSQWKDILTANNQPAPLFLRINSLQTSVSSYQQLLHSDNIMAETVTACPHALRLVTPCATEKLPGFSAGLCSVQDVAGQQAIPLLQLQPGQIVLDACAAPGSKTCHLIETEPQLAKIVAIDRSESRLQQIQENIQRLKLPADKIHLLAADASQPLQWWNQQFFDRILIDAPCSATGVIRRHPDSKLLRCAKDIVQHAQLQLLLLTQLWPLLRPGGLLLYTTCSVLPQENEQIIAHFIKSQNDATIKPITIHNAIKLAHGCQLLPQKNGNDGFYYALMTKNT